MHIRNVYSVEFFLSVVLAVIFNVAHTKKNCADEKELVEYEKNRRQLFQEEYEQSLGAKVHLTEDENIVNDIIMKLKNQEYDSWYQKHVPFNFSRPYFTYRDQIEKTRIYQIIRKMPKGAALHVHSTAGLGAKYMFGLTIKYEDNLYVCQSVDKGMKFYFATGTPNMPCQGNQWKLLKDLRRRCKKNINKKILNAFKLTYDQYNDDFNSVWTKFEHVCTAMGSLVRFRPIREKFIYDLLQAFYDDNIMYIEIRTGIHKLYEVNGTIHEEQFLMQLYERVKKKFQKDHPDFFGSKIIITKHRTVSPEELQKVLDRARALKKKFPHLIAGFDLVGQEDLGKPLHDFLPILYKAKKDINFYFHAGETDWSGLPCDDNLIDAILLGTKRIGHAYSLVKHPVLMKLVSKNNIALEINVISNAVLSLVGDLRNHPLSTYLAHNLSVVLSSDDPGAWGAAPLSHDFYVAFLAVSNKRADLRLLKQLAINSITYSSLNDTGKNKLMRIFNRRWKAFLEYVTHSQRT